MNPVRPIVPVGRAGDPVEAMERLFSTGKIKVETSGPQSKRRQRLVRA
jgi:hypothetical protein